jgi:uncharacterized protein YcgI (DUF1989 family)
MATKREFTHRRPIDQAFYDTLRLQLGERRLSAAAQAVTQGRGLLVHAPAGSLISFEVPDGAQIVNVFFWNAQDPDERYWAEETMLLDGAYLQRRMRLWGTMARFRPLATVIEDTVTTLRRPGEPQAFHHFAHGGSGTPADWRIKGGKAGVASSWERLTGAMAEAGVPARMLTENVSLFQKTAVDPSSQALTILPSDAAPGDSMTWFAEIDLALAICASPYREGGTPPAQLDGSTRPVVVRVEPGVATPLGWPYPGVDYPDLSLYLDPLTGARSTAVGPTPGIGDAP